MTGRELTRFGAEFLRWLNTRATESVVDGLERGTRRLEGWPGLLVLMAIPPALGLLGILVYEVVVR